MAAFANWRLSSRPRERVVQALRRIVAGCSLSGKRKVELPAAPWHVSKDNSKRMDELLQSMKLPQGVSTSLKFVVSSPSYLKSHDYLILAGPVGVWLLEQSGLPDSYRIPLQSLLWLLRDLRARFLDKSELAELAQRAAAVLTELEIVLPLYWSTISVHLILHEAARRAELGPASVTWL